MSPSSRPITLMVCTGGDCRRSKGHSEVLDLARGEPGSVTAACQGICDGPVVGLVKNGEVRWYRRIRGGTLRTLARVLRTNGPRKVLRRHEVRGRRGRVRRPGRLEPVGR